MWQPKEKYAITSRIANYIPLPYRKEVFRRDGKKCQFCGSKMNLGLCHLVPKSRGGKTKPKNLVVACFACRRKKRTLLPLEFINDQISTAELKKIDILGSAKMKVKVIYQDGDEETGEVDKLPSPADNGFYFRPDGNGVAVFISIHAVKKIIQGG